MENGLKLSKSFVVLESMQVNFGLEISMKETNYLISSQHLPFRIIHCADIHLCHSDLFPSQNCI